MTPSKLFLLFLLLCASAHLSATKLLRSPDLRNNTLVFSYANDIYKANIDGSNVTRLTSFQGLESSPKLSPNAQWVAFTAQYGGNNDVYMVNANGGEVKRLTFHPGNDEAVGWSVDGKSVLFRSTRSNAPRGWARLYTVSTEGGNPELLPMNRAYHGSFSPSGDKLVFRRAGYWDRGFRNYRGGQNQALRIIDLDSLEEQDLPFDNHFDNDPIWSNEHIYFLSNKSQVSNVFKYSPSTNVMQQVTQSNAFDVMSFAVDGDTVVYEYLGDLYAQKGTNSPRKINISIDQNFYWLREQYVDASENITGFDLSPTGKRAVFSARGDIFTVPVDKGSSRNLSNSSGSREISPAWSPKGDKIAYFSDASGEYRLVIADQFGQQEKEVVLAQSGFYQHLEWSPDAQRVVFTDQRQQLWIANIGNGTTRIIEQNQTTSIDPSIMASWSPDSNWVAFTIQNPNMMRDLFIYSVEQRKSFKISEGLAEIQSPVWDENGERLYFLASTNFGPKSAWLDMSTISFNPTFHLYYVLLNTNVTSPLLPESDDENAPAVEDVANADVTVNIDFTQIGKRIMPVQSNEGQFSHLSAGKSGHLFYLSHYTNAAGQSSSDLFKYSFEQRSASNVAADVQDYRVSANGESILIQSNNTWQVFDASATSGPDNKQLSMDLSKRVNYSQEWQQIFREAWRYQRDYLYVDNFHGADWNKIYDTYQPLVAAVKHPADLTYLLDALGSEVSVGHSYTGFGEIPDIDTNKIGLLGADFEITSDGVKLAKIYTGERYFPSQNMQAPLAKIAHQLGTAPYLLAVNGKKLDPKKNVFSYFEGTLGKHTSISIGKSADDTNPIAYTVVPIANDISLRRNDWVESNRKYVDEKSGGKLAYVWVPNTAEDGYTSFNRYFFAQAHKKGVIIDERFNHGGFIANYIIDVLRRELNGFFNNPFKPNQPMTSPGSGIWGTQVMLINEVSGSGGDMLPYMFKHYNLGPLIGKRTWGGLVGIWGVPPLIDGGNITAPRSGFYDVNGQWKVENEGVAPDINVEQLTRYTAAGIDPQLDRAIAEALKGLDKTKDIIKAQPQAPVRVPNGK